MINQLRTDFYRLRHTWGIYITLIVTIAYSVIITLNNIVGGIWVVPIPTKILNRLSNKIWTIKDGLSAVSISSTLLMYVFIGIFVITIGYEFSQKTYKNTLTSGITRFSFVVSKYITMLLNIFILMLIYYSTSILVGLINHRTVGVNWITLLTDALDFSVVISFFISIAFGIAIVILLVTGSIVVSSVFIVLFPIIISTLSQFVKWNWLKYFDFFSTALKIAFGMISSDQLWKYILISFIVLILTVESAILIIKNKEL